MTKYIDADALMESINSFIDSMTSCGIVVDAEMLWGKLQDIVNNEEGASLIGIVQTAHDITFTATGTAAQAQSRGIMLGSALTFENLSKELMYAGLFTDEVKAVFDKAKRNRFGRVDGITDDACERKDGADSNGSCPDN